MALLILPTGLPRSRNVQTGESNEGTVMPLDRDIPAGVTPPASSIGPAEVQSLMPEPGLASRALSVRRFSVDRRVGLSHVLSQGQA
jgi:hypothetical protein